MKKSQTIVALLATAILCIGLVSCDRKLEKGDEQTSEPQKDIIADISETVGISTTYATEKETETEESALTDPMHTTGVPTHTDATVTPTKVVTTIASTTAPKLPGASTSPHSTTTVHTTVAVTTTAPTVARPTVPHTTKPPTTEPTTTLPAPINPNTTTPPVIEPPVTERPTDIIVDSEDMDSEQMVISIVNRFRMAEGLGELVNSPELSAAAKVRAKELAVNYSHLRPDGTFWVTCIPGFAGENAGENMAKGFSSADDVTAFWAKNEGNRKTMLTKTFTVTGVGCYYDNATDTYYWVQIFA